MDQVQARSLLTTALSRSTHLIITVLVILGLHGCTNQTAKTTTSEAKPQAQTATYNVIGEVRGLDGNLVKSPLVLALGPEKIALTDNAPFRFHQNLPSGSSFSINVIKQPSNAYCPIPKTNYTISNSDIHIDITCYSSKQRFNVEVAELHAPVAIHIGEKQKLITSAGTYQLEVFHRINNNYPIEIVDPYSEQVCNIPRDTQKMSEDNQFYLQVVCTKNEKNIAYYDW